MLVLNHTLRFLYSAKAVSQVTFVSLVTNQKFSQISPNISKSMDLAAFVLEVAKVFQAARYCYTETWGSSAAQPERFQKAPGSWFIASIKEKKTGTLDFWEKALVLAKLRCNHKHFRVGTIFSPIHKITHTGIKASATF